ncbi:MAG: tetratricopeptide repeat protein [Chloroflexia bacterium]|nr:tetratricopeptide repeat protein [Chloroflexia bacterium]
MGTDSAPIFGDLLRRARREAGFTQEALAERAGISVRAIADLERGVNRAPRRDTLDMLVGALDLSADERRRWEKLRRQESVRVDKEPAPGTRPITFPPQPTRFFGREDELENLMRMVRESETRLVTLTGPGGSGKTRLALEVAAALAGEYPEGVFFVDLAPVSDPNLVLATMAATLGVRPRPDQPLSVTLAGWLAAKRILLVLDNIEQVLDAAPEIGQLLSHCQVLRVMVTSRAPLHLRAEREYPVLPLPLPPVDGAVPASAVAEYDAVRLFIDRARAVRPAFDAAGEDVLVVARIARQLDGLPLAIELAAACIRLFPPATILERLNQHRPLPAGGHRDAPARQRTLRDTIAWSYNLLQPDERALLRRLSIFKGGWTMEAAEAVAGFDAEAEVIDVLNGSETLVEHSLIQAHESLDGSPRFSMLETIREFGLAQLDAQIETQDVHKRHADHLVELFSGSESDWHSPRELSTLRRTDAEIENLRLALDWSLSHDPETALRLACEVAWYWFIRGANLEARRWLEQTLASAVDAPDDLRAQALSWIGWHATTYGDFQAAHLAHEQALALYRRVGNNNGAASCLHGLARNAFWMGDLDQAETLYEEVADRFRKLDSPELPTILGNFGMVLLERGKLDRASVLLDEALALAERRGLIWDRAGILESRAFLAIESGELPQARLMLKVSVQLQCEVQDPRYISQAVETCAWLAIAEGAAEHAARLLGAVAALRDTIGVPIQPPTQLDYDRYVPIAKAQISADVWDRAWADGQSLSQSDVIEIVLQGLE